MRAVELLNKVAGRGIRLAARGDRLVYDGPVGSITPDLLAELREHKPELLEILTSTTTTIVDWDDLPGDWRVDFEERAAIREFDGGQTREHAEAEALREILEEMARKGVVCHAR